eukprot:90869_1
MFLFAMHLIRLTRTSTIGFHPAYSVQLSMDILQTMDIGCMRIVYRMIVHVAQGFCLLILTVSCFVYLKMIISAVPRLKADFDFDLNCGIPQLRSEFTQSD